MAKQFDILILGAGQIGSALVDFLDSTPMGSFVRKIVVIDSNADQLEQFQPDVYFSNRVEAECMFPREAIHKLYTETNLSEALGVVISCLPYHLNTEVAQLAANYGFHYFDTTEDVATVKAIRKIGAGQDTAFVPCCGVAPGLVNIMAGELLRMSSPVSMKVRLSCGAIPQEKPDHPSGYSTTWSPEGLINQYMNPSYIKQDSVVMEVPSLSGLSRGRAHDDSYYEYFYTSGGIGTLLNTYSSDSRVTDLSYKTLRYEGHNAYMKQLIEDCQGGKAAILECTKLGIPHGLPDKVIVDATAELTYNCGDDDLSNLHFEIWPIKFEGKYYSAIQVATAASTAAVVEAVLTSNRSGFVTQESIELNEIRKSQFWKFLQPNDYMKEVCLNLDIPKCSQD